MTSTDDFENGGERLATTQRAVDATAAAYTGDAGLDVGRRLAEEMRSRGFAPGDAWLADVAHRIRSGHHVTFDADPGSTGG